MTMLTIEEHQKLLQNFIDAYNAMISSTSNDTEDVQKLEKAVSEALEMLNINK